MLNTLCSFLPCCVKNSKTFTLYLIFFMRFNIEYMYAVWFIFNHKQCSLLIYMMMSVKQWFFYHLSYGKYFLCIRLCCCIDISIIIVSFIRISFLNLRLTKPVCLYFKICLYQFYLRNKDSFFMWRSDLSKSLSDFIGFYRIWSRLNRNDNL